MMFCSSQSPGQLLVNMLRQRAFFWAILVTSIFFWRNHQQPPERTFVLAYYQVIGPVIDTNKTS